MPPIHKIKSEVSSLKITYRSSDRIKDKKISVLDPNENRNHEKTDRFLKYMENYKSETNERNLKSQIKINHLSLSNSRDSS